MGDPIGHMLLDLLAGLATRGRSTLRLLLFSHIFSQSVRNAS
jgi:hypothetical protein